MKTFRDAASLTEGELRELLASDEPRQRVWAAWELGMRLGEGFQREVGSALTTEPNAGARRHLVVMMAGFGEVDSIVALALHDPEPLVRATACQYVLRFASRDPRFYEALAPTLRDESAYVRRSLALYMDRDAPAWFADVVAEFVEDDDYEVRHATVERILASDAESIPASLQRLAFDESVSVVLRRRIMRAWAERSLVSLLARLEDPEHELGASTVRIISNALDVLPWSVLEGLASSSSPRVASILLDALVSPPHPVEVREWLLSILLHTELDWLDREHAMRRLVESYPAEDMRESERSIASEVRSTMRRHARYLPAESTGKGELAPWRESVDEFRLLEHFLDVLDHFVIPN